MARPKKRTPEHDRDFANMDLAQTLNRVTDDFSKSKAFQQPWLDKFVEWYKLYRSYADPSTFREGRSHLFIPYVFHIIETQVPRLVNTLVNTRPFVQTQPLGYPSPERERRAKKMNLLLDYQFQVKIRFVMLVTDVIKAALMYGTAITRQGWRYERKEIPVRVPMRELGVELRTRERVMQDRVVHDEPFVRNVPIWDFFFDPSSTSIDDCRYVIERQWMDYSEIVQLEETLGVDFKSMEELKRDARSGSSAGDSSNPHLDSIARSATGDNNKRGIEVLHYWTNDRYVVVANQKFTLCSMENPYDHGKKPYSKWVDIPLPNEFYGMGEAEAVEDLQEELNVTRNQRIDNVSLIINKMFKVRRSAQIDGQQLIAAPGGFVEVDEMDDVAELQFTDVTNSAYNEEERIKLDMDVVSGVNDTQRGTFAQRRETATTMNILANAGAERFKLKVALVAYGGMHDMVNQVIRLNQQYISEEQEVLILGKDGTVGSDVVALDDILGEWDIVAVGSAVEPAVNKDIQQSNMTQLYALLKDNPIVNQEQMLKDIFEVFGFKNIQGLINEVPGQVLGEKIGMEGAEAEPQGQMAQQMAPQAGFEAGAPINMGGV